jgi:hypothetical protein
MSLVHPVSARSSPRFVVWPTAARWRAHQVNDSLRGPKAACNPGDATPLARPISDRSRYPRPMKCPEVWPRWRCECSWRRMQLEANAVGGECSWRRMQLEANANADGPPDDQNVGFASATDRWFLLPRTTSASWTSSLIWSSSLNDPYASEASSPFPNNEFLNFVQFLK